ncbi:MAG TPA: class I triheme cytochrome c [Sulfitobacter sp.]|uniref:c-type cytochrome n=1 Tax=Sulfitobacter dubius TaxID=218673 RepID=UPI000C660FCA|nr:class I triheme cytochrome c [Sulfitobacter sp.]HBB81792.1 class I triheme cytochrome c [Sulfitobacter sp.]
MKRVIQTLAAVAATGAVVAVSVVAIGLYNVSAREGHMWGVTWLMHTTFKQSVKLRAPGPDEVPDDLGSPDRVKLGALHFKNACAFCHALPGQPQGAAAQAMEPTPPHVSSITGWTPGEMFWIVNEGVKMTGMPHWPAKDRDDEVWSVVAYLNALPGGAGQVALAGEGRGRASCAQCHGEGGESGNSHIPRLDLLTPGQIAEALRQYRSGQRQSGIMQEAAMALSDNEIATLAQTFGSSKGPRRQSEPAPEATTPGALLAQRGTGDVPACTVCHGPGRQADAPIAPLLTGQSRDYLTGQLRLWRNGNRGGGERARLMRKAAQDLSDADMSALADYFAGLPAE